MDKLLLHPATNSQLEGFISHPVGAILLTGPTGSGKKTLAQELISRLLGIDSQKLGDYPYFLHLRRPEGKSEIPIDEVRQLIGSLKLIVPDQQSRPVNRAVLIEDAHDLSDEAQNALLKLIEEPPPATVFVLSVVSEDKILPTVVSRAQKINVLAPTLEDSLRFYQDIPTKSLESNWRLSRGAPGLLAALLSEDSHPLKGAVESAKQFLSLDQYHRLIILKQFNSKESLGLFLDGLSRVLAALQSESIKRGVRNQKRLLEARKLVDMMVTYHDSNVSSRLIGVMLACELTL
jgi:DNA polymerase-3 subunit delta'